MNNVERPAVDGNWERTFVTNTGPWSIGEIWIDRESARYCLLVKPEHCNATGAMHGGAMATFLDGHGMVVISLEEDGSNHTPTISLHVDFLAPPLAGDWLVAHVELIKKTRTMIFTQAIARVGERVMARSHAIYRNN
ncbi:PaaI family thioesterase [Sphingopyxis macrogoltabida]|uniref:Thioesterase domain-containing protein n=1 Tax=Sphingopyxis macrogoltabida TaxID=33050 RepID=A0AAC9AZB7_SPHMC|nr:PaaI family thioesterase [Sphingopyxis macrogoltabida]ALJ16512.1 thioesterase [Sphingopyxis macrogoltabida]AMU92744.1 hypothetical protein ATM17_31290 [Sphingopyxis macrogoltabida]